MEPVILQAVNVKTARASCQVFMPAPFRESVYDSFRALRLRAKRERLAEIPQDRFLRVAIEGGSRFASPQVRCHHLLSSEDRACSEERN